MKHNLSGSDQSKSEGELSINDISVFLKRSWRVIAISCLGGLSISFVYLVITPKTYEATAKILMAQLGTSKSNANSSLSPLGVNVEDPPLLIARMSIPTSFDQATHAACNVAWVDGIFSPALFSSFTIKLEKGSSNAVDLRTFGPTAEKAATCAQAIFDLIKKSQHLLVEPYIDEANIKISSYETQLTRAKEFIARADKSGSTMGASYLATRDEIRYLLDEITGLKNLTASNHSRNTRLVAPIYTSNHPIAPNKRVVLQFGLICGLLFGLVIALAQSTFLKRSN